MEDFISKIAVECPSFKAVKYKGRKKTRVEVLVLDQKGARPKTERVAAVYDADRIFVLIL